MFFCRGCVGSMSIKSDNWIRRMVRERGMIEPFEPGQVRYLDGQKIVSYGTSSYGYDVRCADEFKIFTNINSTIVDPKGFDEKSFVDLKSAVCVIPPNSFALARTVEYFRIPRSVLTVCLGKSTYARCFRGDTRVALADGTAATLEDMARRADAGEPFRGYSLAANGRIIVSVLAAPRYIGRDALLQIELDNGERIAATADHQFVRRDGHMAAAHTLRPGDALMPLHRALVSGREAVYQPLDGYMYGAHRLAEEWNVRHGIGADLPGAHRRPLGFARRTDRVCGVAAYRNHKVIAVRELPGDHDVYCLTVPEAGNFALQAGVFVRNCGIIVNVTPLEPEWEGHVTLEFSNTTPLPAKIYAHEGICQFLFLQGAGPCEVSYADKAGKYMRQRGVALPKL